MLHKFWMGYTRLIYPRRLREFCRRHPRGFLVYTILSWAFMFTPQYERFFVWYMNKSANFGAKIGDKIVALLEERENRLLNKET